MGQATLVSTGVSEPAVHLCGLCKRYGRHTAVQDANLTVQRGEIYGLIGPDGSGKSSLMKAAAGVLAHDGGTVDVLSVRVDSEAAAERVKGRIGFMPQGLGLNLYAELSVEENIDFFARLRLVPAALLAQRKRRLLSMTRLDRFLDRPMKHLSGGMKQKLGLVCTLIHEPELLILDEPTTGVDPVSRQEFWAILAELLQTHGVTVLVSTAYLDEASRFHRLSLIHDGRVLAQGAPGDICGSVAGSRVDVETQPQIAALDRLAVTFPQVEAVGAQLRVFVPDLAPQAATDRVASLLAGVSVTAIEATAPDLEDAFIALLGRRDRFESPVPAASADRELPQRDRPAIEAQKLIRDFDRFRAVDGVSFRVMPGEIFGLLGANGAGKTTVIKMLTGLLAPSQGTGQVAGADMRRTGRVIRSRIGYMSQAFSLYQDLTVLENLRLYAHIYGVPRDQRRARLQWLIETAGLQGAEESRVARLPLGVRQRLALGCALVHRPRVLFLDEPTSGVDPIGRRRFWSILVHMARAQRVAILVTTHYMNEAEHCDRLALMYAGRIIADATPAALKQSLQQEAGRLLEIATDEPLRALKLLQQAHFDGVSLHGNRLHLLTQNPEQARQRIESLLSGNGLRLLDAQLRKPSLENVFVFRVLAQERQVPGR